MAISGLAVVSSLRAQMPNIDFPAASPACTLKQRVGLTDITVVYSRPSVKGRTIFGGIVPYGEVWRAGANQATKISFSTSVKLEGNEIPAGNYSLFAIPGEQEWTIIISKNVNQWGAFQYTNNDDLVRFPVTPVSLRDASVETFAIEFNRIRDESALLELVWDKTVVPIRLTVDVTDKIVPQIEAAMAAPGKKQDTFYFQAATFYYNHDLDSKKALEWVERRAGGQFADCLRVSAFEGADSGKTRRQGRCDCRRQAIHRTGHQGRGGRQFLREDEPGFDFEPATMRFRPQTKIQH